MLYRYAIGNFQVAVLITPLKRSPWFHNFSAAGTGLKYESAQTILSVLAHGITSSSSTFVPWGIFYLSSFWFSSFFADFKILSRIIIPGRSHAEFWISAPFSGFLYIATYIGKPKFIQWPLCPYHRDMDSSSHMRSEGENRFVWYWLKWVTKSWKNFHRWASWLIPSPRTSGWWLHRTCLHRISKRFLFIPVFPKAEADLYFDWDTVYHRLDLSPNSKRIARIMIPTV